MDNKSKAQFIATFIACCLVATGLVIIFIMIKSQNIAKDEQATIEEKKQNNQQSGVVPLRQLPVINVGEGSEILPVKTNKEMINIKDKLYLQIVNEKGEAELGYFDSSLNYVRLQTISQSADKIKLFQDESISYITREGTFNDESINIAFKDKVYKLSINNRTIKVVDYIYSLEEHVFYVIAQNIDNELELGYISNKGEYSFVSGLYENNKQNISFISLDNNQLYLQSGDECFRYNFSQRIRENFACKNIEEIMHKQIADNVTQILKEDEILYQLPLIYSDLRIVNDEISWIGIDTGMEIPNSKKLYVSKLKTEGLTSIELPMQNILFAGKIDNKIILIPKSLLEYIYVYEDDLNGQLEESEEFENWFILKNNFSYINKVINQNNILPK